MVYELVNAVLTLILTMGIMGTVCYFIPMGDLYPVWVWVGIVILVTIDFLVVTGIMNYFIHYKQESNLRCRILGHNSKRIGMTEHGPSTYKCKRCGKEYPVHDGGM